MTASRATDVLEAMAVVRRVLPNGLTVIVRRDTSAPVVAIVTYVKAGYFDETDDGIGIAHVLEHMFFKGTPTRGVGEIARETKASGGYLNAHTIYDHTSYYTVLPASGFSAGLDIQADAYANSLIDPDELRRELEVIIQEANRKQDNPGAVAGETLYELLHDRHRMRRWRIGREEGLRKLTHEDLVRFYRNFYRPSTTILAIVGDVDAERAMDEVERKYGALTPGEPQRSPGPIETSAPGFRVREWSGDIEQSQLAIGWRTPGTMHVDTPRLDLAAAVLGAGRASRLYQAVRERQLASSVSAFNYTPTELGVFVLHAESPPATTTDALGALWAQLGPLRAHGVRELELERNRRIFESRWLRRLESMEGQASHLAEWESLGGWALGEKYLGTLLSEPVEGVNDAIRRYLDPDQASVVVYRPGSVAQVFPDSMPASARSVLDRASGEVPPEPSPVSSPAIVRRGASFEREEQNVRVYRTETGVPILVRRKKGAPIVHFGVYGAGGASEDGADRAGLTMLMARTTIKGTARRSAARIAVDAETLGGSIGPGTSGESVGWSFSVATAHLPEASELLADVVLNPTFPEDAFETERKLALASVASLRDDMYRYPMRLATEAAFGSHPYGIPSFGTEESLNAITLADLYTCHVDRALRGAGAIAIVGDVDPDDTAALFASHFAALRPGVAPGMSAPAWPNELVQRTADKQKAQTAIALAWPAPSRHDNARFAVQLLAGVASGLGGRFFEELRDKRSLAYTVQAFSVERRVAGMFLTYIATSPEREDEARIGLIEELAKFRDAPVRDDELQLARSYAIGTHAIRQQSGADVLGELVDAWLLGEGLHEIGEHDQRVLAVTASDIRDVAAKWFDDSRRVEGIVRGRS